MREIRTLLVDDEPLASAGLRHLLRAHADVRLIGECRDGRAAAECVRRDAPDLVFLDVQMPDLDGFEMLRALDERGVGARPLVVFVTAYETHAAHAFDVEAVDYLLKPVEPSRLARALARARRVLAGSTPRVAHGDADRAAAAPSSGPAVVPGAPRAHGARSPYLSAITVRTGQRSVLVAVTDIDWIAADDYCVSLIVSGRRHLLRASLDSLETRLDPALFMRVHRSAIVNVGRVAAWHRHPLRQLTLVLRDGTRVAVSRSRRLQVLARLETEHALTSATAAS